MLALQVLQFSIVGIGDCSFASSMFENAYGHIKIPLRNKQNDVIGLVNCMWHFICTSISFKYRISGVPKDL